MSLTAVSNSFRFSSLSINIPDRKMPSKNEGLFSWKKVAILVGLLATGIFFAAYSLNSPDTVRLDESDSQTGLATQITSVTQDVVLGVSEGIMPALGMLGVANQVFRGERNRDMQSEAEDLARKSHHAGRFMIAEKWIKSIPQAQDRNDLSKELARKNYDAGEFDEAEKLIKLFVQDQDRDYLCKEFARKSHEARQFDETEKWLKLIVQNQDRDFLCRELVKKNHRAGEFQEAERFIKLLSHHWHDSLCEDLATKSYDAGQFEEAEKFISLIVEESKRDFLYEELAIKSFEAGRFDEMEKWIQLIVDDWERDSLCQELSSKNYSIGQFDIAEKLVQLIVDLDVRGITVLELVRKSCVNKRSETVRFIRLLPEFYNVSESSHTGVVEECLKGFSEDLIRSLSNASLRKLLDRNYKDPNTPNLIPDCTDSENCPDLNSMSIDTKVLEAATFVSARRLALKAAKGGLFQTNDLELLRFRWDDPREKVLFAVAVADHNGGLHSLWDVPMLGKLDLKYDVKLIMLSKEEILCEAVRSAVKIGRLVRIYLRAHGFSTLMQLGHKSTEKIDRSSDFSSCFANLPPDTILTLISCFTGALTEDGSDNLAQTMADGANRTVIAANEEVFSGRYVFSDSEELYHPSKFDSSKNIFLSFKPKNRRKLSPNGVLQFPQ
jgi:tetratricopeptide (TPR) repeat protein